MKLFAVLVITGLTWVLSSCFSKEEPSAVVKKELVAPQTEKIENKKDKSLEILARLFEQADAIHRETWWVLTSERRSSGRSPFGKVQRALLSSQNVKLTNKSLFRCDRYLVKRDILGLSGFPQKAEIFEKCSDKAEAKKLADFSASSLKEIRVIFYPDNLEEILGLGAAILNIKISCFLGGDEQGKLDVLKCKDWSQDRTKEQMIRLDVYDYEKSGQNIIKLRGKVYENLSDTRKIVADVPMTGKIVVTETELYPPEPTPTPAPVSSVAPRSVEPPQKELEGPPLVLPPVVEMPAAPAPVPLDSEGQPVLTPLHLPPPRQEEIVDPDVMMQRQQGTERVDPVEMPAEGEAYGR